jgi:hypothetical protein
MMGWFSQPYFDEGKAEGLVKGEAKLLTRLLEKRFGSMPGSIQQRISEADAASIEAWSDRMLDAPDLNSIFETG